MVREDFGPRSDIDILVEFEPGHIPGLDFFLIEAELSKLLGHKVDLQTANFLGPEILQSTLSEAVTAYEKSMSKHESDIALHQTLTHAREAVVLVKGKTRADLDQDRLWI